MAGNPTALPTEDASNAELEAMQRYGITRVPAAFIWLGLIAVRSSPMRLPRQSEERSHSEALPGTSDGKPGWPIVVQAAGPSGARLAMNN
jgi:hypothetical protein